jgi:hypothetical protein
MRIGEHVYVQARRSAPAAASIVVVTNEHDPAVNNAVTHDVALAWSRHDPAAVREFCFTDLPRNHDIIEPDNAHARTDVVYPQLLDIVLGAGEMPLRRS